MISLEPVNVNFIDKIYLQLSPYVNDLISNIRLFCENNGLSKIEEILLAFSKLRLPEGIRIINDYLDAEKAKEDGPTVQKHTP